MTKRNRNNNSTKTVTLKIDFKELGINPETAKLTAPEIQDFQLAEEWKNGEQITVEARKGWLIYIE